MSKSPDPYDLLDALNAVDEAQLEDTQAFFEERKETKPVKTTRSMLHIGLIAAALLSLGRGVFTRAASQGWLSLLAAAGIFLLSAALAFRKKHPILIIALSAALGIGAGFALGM